MAFKSIAQYNEDKNKDFFILPNDGDSADVVILFQSADDALVADVHYIKSAEYSGYVHCCGTGCPACAQKLRVQHKIFIPLYNIAKDKIEFWDRTTFMESQLQTDVFANYPNPSEYVFRITRHGQANDRDTRYEIRGVGRNSAYPYAKILADHNAVMPAYYEHACKEVDIATLRRMLSNSSANPSVEYDYTPTPRGGYVPAASTGGAPVSDPVSVPVPQVYNQPPVDIPAADDSDDDVDDVDF